MFSIYDKCPRAPKTAKPEMKENREFEIATTTELAKAGSPGGQ